MPVGTWIYERGSATGSGGGGGVPPDAPPVTIGIPEVEEISNGKVEVRVPWTKNASATVDSFKGVGVFLEDPDMSQTPTAPMDNTTPMDDSHQMAGKWIPVKITETTESPATFRIDSHVADRFIRVYLQAYNNVVSSTITRANKPGATPNVRIPIPAGAGEYVLGQEHAWFITNPHVDLVPDFENVGGAKFYMHYSFTPPDPTIPLPPGLKPFGGVQIFFRYPEEENRTAPENQLLATDDPAHWISGLYAARTITFQVLFCSMDIDRQYNTPIYGTTPSVEVHLDYDPTGGATPDLTAFTITPTVFEWQPDGTIFAQADFAWTIPDSVRWSQVGFFVIDRPGHAPYEILDMRSGGKITSKRAKIIDWPKLAPEDWTIAAISFDTNGKMSDDPNSLQAHTPRAVWHLTPATTGDAPFVTPPAAGLLAITYEQQLNSDGVVMMRQKITGWTNPTGNKFGGVSIARMVHSDDPLTGRITWWDAKLNETSLTTPWEPAPSSTLFDYFFVSRDPQGNRNQLLPGVTPAILSKQFDPIAGNVIVTRLPKDWFNEAEFEWPTPGLFTVEQIVAPKIYVGSILRVGGGPATAGSDGLFKGMHSGQVAVYSSSNILRAWMGQQDSVIAGDKPAVSHSVFGGWFAELYVGGDSPVNAPLYATQTGQVIVGGFDVAGSRYPYISIRDKFGTEKGRIGARLDIAQSPPISPSDPAAIAGAWFQEFAAGGQSLYDWRILARRDTGAVTDLVTFRNINKFQIDYQADYNPGGQYPTNPQNAANTLLFGFDAYVADSNTSTYRKFPGLSITRTGTGHQAVLINRGLVLNMPTGTPPYSPVRAAAFVTYNGDPNGGDGGTFWSELTMISHIGHNMNVELSSGKAGDGNSFFTLRDASNNITFSVDGLGNVTIRGSLTMASLSLSSLTVSGTATIGTVAATNVTTSADVMARTYYRTGTLEVISNAGQFTGSGGVNTAGDIRSSASVSAGTGATGGSNGYFYNGQQFIDNAGPGGAMRIVRDDGYVLCRQFFAYDTSASAFNPGSSRVALVLTTPTGTVTLRINGGIITGIT